MLFTHLKPMLPVWCDESFDNEAFLFEPKWDGARILLHKQGDRLEAYTRSGVTVTSNFPELREVVHSIRPHTAILDCEGICLRGGRPVFDDFMYRLRLGRTDTIRQACHTHPAAWVVFDVLMTSGRDHMDEPLTDRKRRLDEALVTSSSVLQTIYLENKGTELFTMTERQGMEGIVAKRKASRYSLNARSPDWMKIKHTQSIDAVILGYKTDPFRIMIGLQFRTVKNKPVGIIQEGLEPEHRDWFLEEIKGDIVRKDGDAFLVEPRICCRIQYRDRTDMHQLRHTRFVAFLPDRRADECIWH